MESEHGETLMESNKSIRSAITKPNPESYIHIPITTHNWVLSRLKELDYSVSDPIPETGFGAKNAHIVVSWDKE